MTDKEIKITNENIKLPIVEILTGRGFITGKSGSGKSNTSGVLCESLLNKNFPLLIIDTDGEYYGLKEKYELLHVGADEECDLQIDVEHTEKISQLALNKNVPVILDVSGYLDKEKSKDIIENLLNHIFNKEKKMKKPFLVIFEEIHEYLPEQTNLDSCAEMIVRIAKRGRKRGLGIIGLSQRPADVKKDFITQCNWRVWHNLDWNNDLTVVRKVLGKDYEDKLKGFDAGEAILEAGFLDNRIEEVKFKKKKTFDAGSTPDLDSIEAPELKSISDELVSELQKISEKKKERQDELEKLKKENEKLEEELEKKDEELERAKDLQNMAKQFTDAMSSGGGKKVREKVEEIRENKNKRIRELEKNNKKLNKDLKEYREEVENLEEFREYKDKVEKWEKRRDVIKEALNRLKDVLDIEIDEDVEKYKDKVKELREENEELKNKYGGGKDIIGSERYERMVENIARRHNRTTKKGLKKIINELKRKEATRKQLSVGTGYANSTLTPYLSALKNAGWIKKEGNKLKINWDQIE